MRWSVRRGRVAVSCVSSSILIGLAVSLAAPPSVGVDTRPLAQVLGQAEVERIENELLTRLYERGHAVTQANAAIDVALLPGRDKVLVVARHDGDTTVSEIDTTGPHSIVQLELVHHVLELVDRFPDAREPEAQPRARVALAGMNPAGALRSLVHGGVMVAPPGHPSDHEVCIVERGGRLLAFHPGAELGCGVEPPELRTLGALLPELAAPPPKVEPPAEEPASTAVPTPRQTSATHPTPDPDAASTLPPEAPAKPVAAKVEPKAWRYTSGLAVGALFRGAYVPASGFDGTAELMLAFHHPTGVGLAASANITPSGATELRILEVEASAGPAFRRPFTPRVLLLASAQVGALFHHAWYGGEPMVRRVDFDAAVPIRLLIALREHLAVYVSLIAGFAHRHRRHWDAADEVVWERGRFRVGLSIGLAFGGVVQ